MTYVKAIFERQNRLYAAPILELSQVLVNKRVKPQQSFGIEAALGSI